MSQEAQRNNRHDRRIRNFMLQPLIQIKLGLYSIVLSLAFSLVVLGILYINLYRFYDMVLELTDLREEVTRILESYLTETVWWVVICIFVYVIFNIIMSIFYTHRLVGPTYAFRRHVNALIKRNYKTRIVLRKNDAFHEVADDLNRLAESFDKDPPR